MLLQLDDIAYVLQIHWVVKRAPNFVISTEFTSGLFAGGMGSGVASRTYSAVTRA